MYTIAICDDDPSVRDDLTARVRAFMAEKSESCAVKAFPSGLAVLDDPAIDILFLDIQMPGLDGMEIARALRKAGSTCAIVFTTVLEDYVFDAFEVDATDYLVKPISSQRFRRAMAHVLKVLSRRDRRQLLIQRGDELFVVPYDRIIYCEIHGRKMDLHLDDGRVLTYPHRIGELEKELGDDFFRCHRGFLVHLRHVASCAAGTLTASDGSQVPVSRLREKALRQAMIRYMGRNST